MVRQMVSPALAISLIGGATLNIWSDYLEAGGPVFFVRNLTNAGVVTLPAGQRGQPERAAVGVWDRRGHYAIFVPANSADAPRAVEAIYQARPDLRAQGLPRGVTRATARAVARVDPQGKPNERLVAVVAHLSVLFFPLLLPLILWGASTPHAPYAARQARQAFLFHLSIIALDTILIVALIATSAGSFIGALVSGDPGSLGIGVLAILAGGLAVVILTAFGLGYSIFAAIETFRGHPFSYPLLRRL